MRDAFGCIFPVVEEENKAHNTAQDINFNGIHVSSNAYYGYQPLPQKEQEKGETYEYMDVQINDSGIQFNNFINPEDRLSGLQAPNNIMRGPENRKRRWSDDAPTTDFKKRREYEPMPVLPTTNRYVNARQPTHNIPDMPRGLMGHFI